MLFSVDATHFVLGAFLGILWSSSCLFLRASAGRKRFNVIVALNAITHELVTVTSDIYITAESVCALLRRIADLNLRIPIILVMENARYRKMQNGQHFGCRAEHRATFPPCLLAKLKFDRAALEIRQEETFVFATLRHLRRLSKSHYRLLKPNAHDERKRVAVFACAELSGF